MVKNMEIRNIMILVENKTLRSISFSSNTNVFDDTTLSNALAKQKANMKVINIIDGSVISDNGVAVMFYNDTWFSIKSSDYKSLDGCDYPIIIELIKYYMVKMA